MCWALSIHLGEEKKIISMKGLGRVKRHKTTGYFPESNGEKKDQLQIAEACTSFIVGNRYMIN